MGCLEFDGSTTTEFPFEKNLFPANLLVRNNVTCLVKMTG